LWIKSRQKRLELRQNLVDKIETKEAWVKAASCG